MHGSYVESREKFQVKKKDPVKNKIKKADRAWREKRKNRHETA